MQRDGVDRPGERVDDAVAVDIAPADLAPEHRVRGHRRARAAADICDRHQRAAPLQLVAAAQVQIASAVEVAELVRRQAVRA